MLLMGPDAALLKEAGCYLPFPAVCSCEGYVQQACCAGVLCIGIAARIHGSAADVQWVLPPFPWLDASQQLCVHPTPGALQ